jgi:DNA-binding transcriptional regulator YdaS (Cro superfamily)
LRDRLASATVGGMDKQFPAALTAYLEKTGLKQAELAAKLGVNYATVYYWSVGQRQPSPKMARLINTVTGIALSRIRPDIWPRADVAAPGGSNAVTEGST